MLKITPVPARRRLYLKIFFSMILVTLISLIIVALGIVFFYHDQGQRNLQQELVKNSQEAIHILQPVLEKGERNEFIQKARLVKSFIRGTFVVFDRDAQPMAGQKYSWKVQVLPWDRETLLHQIQTIPSGQYKIIKFSPSKGGKQFLAVASPLYHGKTFLGAVIIIAPMTNLKTTMLILRNSFLVIGIIAIILAAVVSYFLTAKIVRPIHQISESVMAYAQGAFHQRVPVTTKDELGQLAENINYVAAELESFIRSQREFVANVSHELRTPLSLIQGYLEALQDGYATTPQKTADFLKITHQETLRLKRLLENLLLLSRIESDPTRPSDGVGPTVKTRPEPIALNEVLQYVLATLKAEATRKQLDIRQEVSSNNLLIAAGRDQLTQVLLNLINNAISYSPPGTVITVKTTMDDQKKQAVFTVSDQGPGIPKHLQERIWDRFYRIEESRNRESGGFGLGLAIVKNLVQNMNGSIELQSEAGKGSTFIVRFNLKETGKEKNLS